MAAMMQEEVVVDKKEKKEKKQVQQVEGQEMEDEDSEEEVEVEQAVSKNPFRMKINKILEENELFDKRPVKIDNDGFLKLMFVMN